MSSVCIIPEDVPVQVQWTDGVYSKDDENISLHLKMQVMRLPSSGNTGMVTVQELFTGRKAVFCQRTIL